MTTRGQVLILLFLLVALASDFTGASDREDPSESQEYQAITLVPQIGQSYEITSVAISSDGRYAVSGSQDFSVVLWDIGTGWEIRRFMGHTDAVTSVAFGPDGRTVLSGSNDGSMILWDTYTGEQLQHFSRKRGRLSRVISRVGEPFTGSASPEIHTIQSVAIDPHGIYAVCGSSDGIVLWDVETGDEIRRLERRGRIARWYRVPINSVAFSPNGKYVISGDVYEEVRLWEVGTGKSVCTLKGHDSSVTSVAFGGDGRLAVSGSEDGKIILWDVAAKESVGVYRHDGPVHTVALSWDNRYIVSSSADTTVRLWQTADHKEVRRVRVLLPSLAFSRDGTFVLGGTFGFLLGWQVETIEPFRDFMGYSSVPNSVAIHGDSLLVGSGDLVWLWDLRTGRPARRFAGHNGIVWSVAFSPSGRFALSGSHDNTVRLWDIDTGQELHTFIGHTRWVSSVAYSPNGLYGLSGAEDSSLVLWNVGRYTQEISTDGPAGSRTIAPRDAVVYYKHTSAILSVAFSPDSRYVLAGAADAIVLWDLTDGRIKRPFKRSGLDHFSLASSVAFGPQGFHVLGGSWRGDTRVWNAKTGQELRILDDGGSVNAICFSPDGRHAFSAGEDKAIHMWDLKHERRIARFDGHGGEIHSLAISDDGRILCSTSRDGTTRLWNTESKEPVAALVCSRRLEERSPDWVVVTPEGRFETDELEAVEGLHWIAPDDPLTPLPIEIYMRDYLEYRLLTRLLCNEELPQLRDLGQLNRVQPQVEITYTSPLPGKLDIVRVGVHVENSFATLHRDGKDTVVASGVYDVRLFRNGQLVAQWPDPGTEPLGQMTLGSEKEIAHWRAVSAIPLDSAGKADTSFLVRLPRREGMDRIEFSAYAFNSDRVKSSTGVASYPVPAALEPMKGRAYIMTIGVTNTQDSYWSLDFASEDARLMGRKLKEALQHAGDYEDVVHILMVGKRLQHFVSVEDEASSIPPTKANIKTVLDLLAGIDVEEAGLNAIPAEVLQRIHPAAPHDLVILSFSTHGVTDKKGQFYLLPYDIGRGSHGKITDDLLRRAISSQELSLWLRRIDGDPVVVIIDACYSQASVEGGGFKPGPMGDRGLGQLAYDKGMPILVAAQADYVARESAQVGGYSLLTQAIAGEAVTQHLAARKDGSMTLMDVLEYATHRVPAMRAARGSGRCGGSRGLAQQPMLFDFRRKKTEIVLAR